MPYAENYAPHNLTLSDSTVCWRYMGFPAFAFLLQRRELFFPKLATLAKADPFEGKYPKSVIAELGAQYRPFPHKGEYPDGEAFARAMESRTRNLRAVNCWHMSDVESAAMWKLYGGERGIAIQTTLRGLKESFRLDDRNIYLYQVEYLDFSNYQGDSTLPFFSGFAKRPSFQHERELRAYAGAQENDPSPGLFIRVDLDCLIERVFIAPECEPWVREVVEGLLRIYELPREVKRSTLYDDELL